MDAVLDDWRAGNEGDSRTPMIDIFVKYLKSVVSHPGKTPRTMIRTYGSFISEQSHKIIGEDGTVKTFIHFQVTTASIHVQKIES